MEVTGSIPVTQTKVMKGLSTKIALKRFNAEKEGIEFVLTKEQILSLLATAGITPKDWNLRGYHLSRYNDQGNYEIGNCRFILASQNYREKKISQASRAASARNIAIANKKKTPTEMAIAGRLGGLASIRSTNTKRDSSGRFV